MSVLSRQRSASLCVLLGATVIVASANRPSAPAPPVLRPGSADLDVSHIRERTDSTQYAVRDAKGQPTGATAFRHDEEHLIDDPRGKAVMLVNSNRDYADTAIVLRSSLRPIREMQHYVSRRRQLVFEYDGNRVRVRDSTADSAVRIREHTYDGDVFHFNELNLIIRSLPFREGYEAILPLYSEGSDALEMDTVRVLGKDDRGAWTVRFADPVVIVTHTVDATTRRLLSSKGGRRDTTTSAKKPGVVR